jgi:cytochrome c oxidase subunit 2
MGTLIERYLPAASTYASDIDGVIALVAIIVGFWGVLAELVLIGLVIAYRKKPGVKAEYITGEQSKEMAWISYPHYVVLVCDILIIIAAVRVLFDVKQDLPPPDRTVRVIAQQWAWSFVHPGPDQKLGTEDDISTVDQLRVEVG